MNATDRVKLIQHVLGVDADGIAGPKTQTAWQHLVSQAAAEQRPALIAQDVPPFPTTIVPWLKIALAELGTTEIPGPQDNPRIVEYHSATTLKATDDETPWCAAFVNWCLEKAGYKGTGSAAAVTFKEWAAKAHNLSPGAVVVFKRPGGHHVGFLYACEGDDLFILGGNQGNRVSIARFPASAALAFRWPTERSDA